VKRGRRKKVWEPKPAGFFATTVNATTGRATWVGCGHPAERDINDDCLTCHAALTPAGRS